MVRKKLVKMEPRHLLTDLDKPRIERWFFDWLSEALVIGGDVTLVMPWWLGGKW